MGPRQSLDVNGNEMSELVTHIDWSVDFAQWGTNSWIKRNSFSPWLHRACDFNPESQKEDPGTVFLMASWGYSLHTDKASVLSPGLIWSFAGLPISKCCASPSDPNHFASLPFLCLMFSTVFHQFHFFNISQICPPCFPPLSSLPIPRPMLFLACIIERGFIWLQCSVLSC